MLDHSKAAAFNTHYALKLDISSWAYPITDSSRDLRIDFLRGIVMFVLIVVHIDIFSIYNLLAWERLGVISGAEGFTIFSGVVLGMVYRKKIEKDGWQTASSRLIDRALQIYRVNIAIIISIIILGLIPWLDASTIMTFTSHSSGEVYTLFPSYQASIQHWLSRIFLLRMGPHQTQVLGLYVVLLAFAPLALWLFHKKRPILLLSLCWILYFYNWENPSRPTGAQFEYGFPILSWQLIFFHGMAFGYYRAELATWFTGYKKTVIISISIVLSCAFLFFTLNNPNPALPDWYKLSIIPAEQFYAIYRTYFEKNTLGFLRLVNYLAVLIVVFQILSIFWKPIKDYLGWFFIPIGQATLYVFIIHVFMCMLVDNIPYYSEALPNYFSGNIWLNTIAHSTVLLVLWLMVKYKVAFRWIPR